jgi:ATPase subunit of ABC transporter with duplicated ATPase domains
MIKSMAQSRPIVTGRELSLGYNRRAAFEGVSFDIHRGEILGIVGPNGSGKTTLLRTILGLLKPLRGRVEREAGLAFSYVPQRDRIDTILPVTALEVVLMGRAARAGPLQRVHQADRDAGRRALALLGAESLGPLGASGTLGRSCGQRWDRRVSGAWSRTTWPRWSIRRAIEQRKSSRSRRNRRAHS